MWIDTHCHLDAEEFDGDRDAVVSRARAAGVGMLVIPSARVEDFGAVRELAHRHGMAYALGLHPLWLAGVDDGSIERLRAAVRESLDDPRLVAVGEIGIDLLEPVVDLDRQQWIYAEQLKIARDAGLPVIVHVRRSADALLKSLRRIDVAGGIVHAFNGSEQQAAQFVARGFKLGFGGALTYTGSHRIRRHAATLGEQAWVLETDAPYIAPSWRRSGAGVERTEPCDLPRIAGELAQLRGIELVAAASCGRLNAVAALPRLGALLPSTD